MTNALFLKLAGELEKGNWQQLKCVPCNTRVDAKFVNNVELYHKAELAYHTLESMDVFPQIFSPFESLDMAVCAKRVCQGLNQFNFLKDLTISTFKVEDTYASLESGVSINNCPMLESICIKTMFFPMEPKDASNIPSFQDKLSSVKQFLVSNHSVDKWL
jgi:hypothetical protein